MKNFGKKILVKNNTSKVNSTVSIDKKLDNVKDVKFVSNKVEEVNKMVSKFKLSF